MVPNENFWLFESSNGHVLIVLNVWLPIANRKNKLYADSQSHVVFFIYFVISSANDMLLVKTDHSDSNLIFEVWKDECKINRDLRPPSYKRT